MNKLVGATGADRSEVFPLDDVDRAIISELQVDGRMSYAELGPRVGLSQAAARQRVNRLTERGVMQIVAVTDPLSLGLSTQAMVGITVVGDVRVGGRSAQRVDPGAVLSGDPDAFDRCSAPRRKKDVEEEMPPEAADDHGP